MVAVTKRNLGNSLSTLERKYGNVCGERDGSSSRSEDELDAPYLRGGATKKSARPVATRRADRGLRTISALVVVEYGQGSTSSSCLDLASQAPSANVAVFTF